MTPQSHLKSATMFALGSIMAKHEKAIQRAVEKKPAPGDDLHKAIIEEFKQAGRIDSITYMDFTVIYVPDRDEEGPYCSEILALEIGDEQHFPPFAELQAEYSVPDEADITGELRA